MLTAKLRQKRLYGLLIAGEMKTQDTAIRNVIFHTFQVLDDQKNWWKVRNSRAGIGYVPKTIIESYNG